MRDAFALILALATTPAPTLPPAQHLATIVVHAPKAALTLQVAKTDEEREIGLMNVTSMPEHTGMVFVFPDDAEVSFWMKNTLIPLDMVFVSKAGVVRSIAARVPIVPLTMPDANIPIEQGEGKYVIELASGEAQADGIVAGTKLTGLPR